MKLISRRNLAVLLLGLSLGFANAAKASDECEFIREAIRALPSTGGVVEVPAGNYHCSSAIVLDKNFSVLKGLGEVNLILNDNSNSPVIVMGQITTPPPITEGVVVSNIKIYGNQQNQQMECWGGPCDGHGTAAIRNNGISVRGILNGRIENVFVDGARSGGVVTEHNCRNLSIDGLTSMHNFFDGFAGYVTYESHFKNMILAYNRAAGISIDIDFSTNEFDNVKILNNGDVGIFMRHSNANHFNNLDIKDSGSHGIFLAIADGSWTCPTDNEFFNLSVERSRGAGFRLNNDCKGNLLTGFAHFVANDQCVSEGDNGKLSVSSPDKMICQNK